MLDASFSELGLVALLVVIVVVAPIAPKIGEAIGGFFHGRSSPR